MCTQCHSFSAHLFERLGSEFGPFDGMNLKQEFCEALLLACDSQVTFGGQAEYGMSYCEQHVGLDGDKFWSYPYTDREYPTVYSPFRSATKLSHDDLYCSMSCCFPKSVVNNLNSFSPRW